METIDSMSNIIDIKKVIKSFNEQQEEAFFKLLHSIFTNKDKSFVLSGVSGSGKTKLINNLANFLLNDLNLSVNVTALTGKAVMNIRKHLNANIRTGTLHGFLTECKYYNKEDYYFDFLDNKQFYVHFNKSVFIIDESSMIPQTFLDYLLEKEGIILIFVGDKEQLGPIGKNDINIMNYYDYHLDKIERTNNDIVDLSKKVRETGKIPKNFNSPNVEIINRNEPSLDWIKKNISKFDVMICGTNRTKDRLNVMAREAEGFESEMPEIGETIVCRKNYHDMKKSKPIYNGELFEVINHYPKNKISKVICYEIVPKHSNFNEPYLVYFHPETWNQREVNTKKFDIKQHKYHNYIFDFGYAITCHSSQGSEWNNVVFINENVSYFLEQKRFVYTGVTRAIDHVTIFTK